MKKYISILLLLSFSLLSCDPIIYFDVNGEKKHYINCDCSVLEISSAVFLGKIDIIIQPLAIKGTLNVDTDSLKIIFLPQDLYKDTKIYSMYNGEKINGKFVFKEYISIGFDFEPPQEPYLRFPSTIMILPCGYIKCNDCNDKPLITDTIRIDVKENAWKL